MPCAFLNAHFAAILKFGFLLLEALPTPEAGPHGNQMERENIGSGESMLLPLVWARGPELIFLAAPKQPTAAEAIA